MNATLVTNLESNLVPVRNGVLAEELAVSNTVVTAAALSSLASHVELSVKTASVLVTFDGTDPDAGDNVGVLLATGIYHWPKYKLVCARFIRSGETNAKIRIEPMSD